MAEFDAPEKILAAAERAAAKGYREMDAFTPFPMEELTDALKVKHTKLSLSLSSAAASPAPSPASSCSTGPP